MIKIGIAITGVSYGIGRNYKHCFPIMSETLIEAFRKDNDVKIYLTSYKNEFETDIIDLYKPVLYQFNDFEGSHQVLTYIKAMEQIRNQDLDFVICTRFDIHFHKKISEIGLDITKFNALFKEKGWWDNMKFTTDNLFAFPYSMLETFITVLKELYINPSRPGQMDLHQVFHRMQNEVKSENTKIISNLDELSNTNSFYSVCNQKWGVR